jgi:hypothetical protein
LQRRRSNQEFAPGEMGFNGLFAQQQPSAAHVALRVNRYRFTARRKSLHVRNASKADVKSEHWRLS